MRSDSKIPSRVNGLLVMPVQLPALPCFPTPIRHYLYASAHEPKHPDQLTPLSLFVVNLPIDANDILLKHLFSEQLGLPAGRIRNVHFVEPRGRSACANDASTTRNQMTLQKADAGPDKKRKRDVDLQEQAAASIDIDLPSTWSRTVLVAGTNAILVFVDRASRDAALKAIKSAARSEQSIVWGDGLNKKLPPLGLQRAFGGVAFWI